MFVEYLQHHAEGTCFVLDRVPAGWVMVDEKAAKQSGRSF